jgi:SAM-dependent methyltransferase
MLLSKICTKADFDAEWFQRWRPMMVHHTANGIRLGRTFLHRKEWELVFICQALEERGLLTPGKRGIGFAVGLEPLPAILASRGCKVLATDKKTDSGGHWEGQWASGKSDLSRPQVCDPSVLESNVDFRSLDMNNIPSNLQDFDFSWSCCALEHLGSLRKGLVFLMNQMRCLKPGGTAVHTLEFNLSSNKRTVKSGDTAVYRRTDIERFAELARREGHAVEEIDFSSGDDPLDQFIARPPWDDTASNLAHLRLMIGPFVCTSLALIMTKGTATKRFGLLRALGRGA